MYEMRGLFSFNMCKLGNKIVNLLSSEVINNEINK